MNTNERQSNPRSAILRMQREPASRVLRWGWALLALTCGCSAAAPPVGDVEGKVSFGGEPVTGANVVFENTERGWLRAAEIDSTGTYRMTGVKTAEYTVSIQPPTPPTPNENTHPDGKFVISPEMIPDPKNIPKPFREAHSSSLTADVKAGPNQFDFELSSGAK